MFVSNVNLRIAVDGETIRVNACINLGATKHECEVEEPK